MKKAPEKVLIFKKGESMKTIDIQEFPLRGGGLL